MYIIYVKTNRIEDQCRSLWFDAFVKMIKIKRNQNTNQNSDISYTYIYIFNMFISRISRIILVGETVSSYPFNELKLNDVR